MQGYIRREREGERRREGWVSVCSTGVFHSLLSPPLPQISGEEKDEWSNKAPQHAEMDQGTLGKDWGRAECIKIKLAYGVHNRKERGVLEENERE